jgi:hypothetical protein
MYHLVPMPTSFEIKDVDDGARWNIVDTIIMGNTRELFTKKIKTQ